MEEGSIETISFKWWTCLLERYGYVGLCIFSISLMQ